MKILIVNLGSITDNIASTCLIKRIKKNINNHCIYWCVPKEEDKYILKYNKNIKEVFCFDELRKKELKVDLVINLGLFFPHEKCINLKTNNALGFGFNIDAQDYFEVFYGNKYVKNLSYLQLLYKLIGDTWRGEGYDLNYYPRSRSKRKRVGIAVAHANLRNYVYEHFDLDSFKLWNIPYKKNIFKRMDEINKCKRIVTDDLLTFHLAMALRKYVYFLEIVPHNFKLEMFGNGEVYKVPKDIIQ